MDEFTARQLIRLGHLERMIIDLVDHDDVAIFEHDWISHQKHNPDFYTEEEGGALGLCAAVEKAKTSIWEIYEIATENHTL